MNRLLLALLMMAACGMPAHGGEELRRAVVVHAALGAGQDLAHQPSAAARRSRHAAECRIPPPG
ncbi:MAG: hypothetical protein MZV70_63505 [Desulfobacterales bacterium]|nr:hypothetical protein [Desulfobacterales bacterium]